MNIYFLDRDPRVAAEYHNDRHVIYTCLSYQKLLHAAHLIVDGGSLSTHRLGRPPTELAATARSPAAKWIAEANMNYVWTHQLYIAVLDQYRARFGRQHVQDNDFARVSLRRLPANIECAELTSPPLIMPRRYWRPDVIDAYRVFYANEKNDLAFWSPPAKTPDWWEMYLPHHHTAEHAQEKVNGTQLHD